MPGVSGESTKKGAGLFGQAEGQQAGAAAQRAGQQVISSSMCQCRRLTEQATEGLRL